MGASEYPDIPASKKADCVVNLVERNDKVYHFVAALLASKILLREKEFINQPNYNTKEVRLQSLSCDFAFLICKFFRYRIV